MDRFILTIVRASNLLALLGVLVVLILASGFELVYQELPCPLCLLQRVGFICIAFGLLLNLRFGPRPSHYAVILISALLTCFIALRQIALHVLPGSGAYGDPVLGFHLYTWSFIFAVIIIITMSLLLGLDRQYQIPHQRGVGWRATVNLLFLVTALLAALNVGTVFLECGITQCPDNPVRYEMLNR